MRKTIILASIGAPVMAAALYFSYTRISSWTEPPTVVATLSEAEARAAISGYNLGEIKQFTYRNIISLRTDRSNDTVSDHVQLPPGFIIEDVWSQVTHKRHHATYKVSWRQPMSVSLGQTVAVSLRERADGARGFLTGKGKIGALAEAKQLSEALNYASFASANSHATITYSGFADGRRYSSKDGELDVTTHVKARYVGTVEDISRELTDLAAVLTSSSAEVIAARTGRIKKVMAASSQAAGGSGTVDPEYKPEAPSDTI